MIKILDNWNTSKEFRVSQMPLTDVYSTQYLNTVCQI